MDIDKFIKTKIKSGTDTKSIKNSLVDLYGLTLNEANSAVKRVRRSLNLYNNGDTNITDDNESEQPNFEKFHKK